MDAAERVAAECRPAATHGGGYATPARRHPRKPAHGPPGGGEPAYRLPSGGLGSDRAPPRSSCRATHPEAPAAALLSTAWVRHRAGGGGALRIRPSSPRGTCSGRLRRVCAWAWTSRGWETDFGGRPEPSRGSEADLDAWLARSRAPTGSGGSGVAALRCCWSHVTPIGWPGAPPGPCSHGALPAAPRGGGTDGNSLRLNERHLR